MKRITLFLILFVSFYTYSEDFKFPGTFGFLFTLKPALMDSSDLKSESYNDYFKIDKIKMDTQLQGSILFLFKDFYTLFPWIENHFLLESSPWIGDYMTFGVDNKFSILRGTTWLDVAINTSFQFDLWNKGENTIWELAPNAFIQGKNDDIDLRWRLTNTAKITMNPKYIIKSDTATTGEGFYDNIDVETFLGLAFNFFHFFAPENLKCYLYAEDTFKFVMPYSYKEEKEKQFLNEVKAGIKFDVDGFKPFLYYWLRTYNYYNSSFPLDGSSGSNVKWLDSNEWSGDPIHENTSIRMGTRVGVLYAKDWFTFSIEYYGDIETMSLLYNSGGQYSQWKSIIEMWIQLKIGGRQTHVFDDWEY